MKRFLLTILLLAGVASAFAQNVLPKPNPPRLVNDAAGVLAEGDRESLEQRLVAFDDSTSNQIVIVTIKTLDDVAIEDYSHKLFNDWGIGTAAHQNGILILIAVNDHKARIEVGRGLEGAITDAEAGDIIEYDLAPAFRKGDYYSGFISAVESLGKAAAGEYSIRSDRGGSGGNGGGFKLGFLVVIIIIFIIIARSGRGGGGGLMSNAGSFFLGSMIGSSLGRGGWGGGGWSGGGGGGGGFGGFGGGSSGGGGASGGW